MRCSPGWSRPHSPWTSTPCGNGDPAASEARFRAALAGAKSEDERLELRTQIARTFSLRGRFAEAERELDAIEPRLAQ
ncbi:MAG TPA: hypothetical protein VLU41_15380, partial [Ideonella sp.]|nr:hypothetical protein [Ideonella sp.]